MPARIGRFSAGVERGHPDTIRKAFSGRFGESYVKLLLKFPTKYGAEQVSTKYCTCLINIAIILT